MKKLMIFLILPVILCPYIIIGSVAVIYSEKIMTRLFASNVLFLLAEVILFGAISVQAAGAVAALAIFDGSCETIIAGMNMTVKIIYFFAYTAMSLLAAVYFITVIGLGIAAYLIFGMAASLLISDITSIAVYYSLYKKGLMSKDNAITLSICSFVFFCGYCGKRCGLY